MMHTILEWCGLTSYQASCLSPVLWMLIAMIAINFVAGLIYDERQSGKNYRRGRFNGRK